MNQSEVFSPIPIKVECEENLVKLVHKLTGIRIHDYQLTKFRQTITDSCQKFNFSSCESYLQALQNSSLNSELQEHLIAGVTIGESYFFRDRSHMGLLKQLILPNLIRKRREQGSLYLRIWSAGCSDGQELYSILMLLIQLIPDIDNWKLHLLGTDINVAALSRALKGEYKEWSLRSVSNSLRNEFFTYSDNQWLIKKSLRQLTKFSYLNLYADNFPSILSETNAMDLILCRNVFIYFDQSTVSSIMTKFYQSLSYGGYLIQGASDLLDNTDIGNFEQHFDNKTSYLTRSENITADNKVKKRNTRLNSNPVKSLKIEINPQAEFAVTDKEGIIDKPLLIDSMTDTATALHAYENIISLLTDEAWEDALYSIEQCIVNGDDNAIIWQFKAKALANLGQNKKALEACSLSIQHDAEDKHTYFIQALVYMERRQFDKAEESLRQTLYLDRQFVEAHYHLGLLYLLQGSSEIGLKYLHNALEITEQAVPERSLHDAAGMDHARMATILRSEIRMYKGEY